MLAPHLHHRILPATTRLPLGASGLAVSPVCIGVAGSPDTVLTAYEAGVNFFFISADLHWPIYESTRLGLQQLLAGKRARRQELVIGVVSYLSEPLFSGLQFQEVVAAVPGLDHVDLLIAGAMSDDANYYSRIAALQRSRVVHHVGAGAIGATIHQRPYAVVADRDHSLDIMFVRYNTAHPGARADVFPYLQTARQSLMFAFKSMQSRVTAEDLAARGWPGGYWVPDAVDYYRFALSRPEFNGVLCSPGSPEEVNEIVRALEKPPLSEEEQQYMMWISRATGRHFR